MRVATAQDMLPSTESVVACEAPSACGTWAAKVLCPPGAEGPTLRSVPCRVNFASVTSRRSLRSGHAVAATRLEENPYIVALSLERGRQPRRGDRRTSASGGENAYAHARLHDRGARA